MQPPGTAGNILLPCIVTIVTAVLCQLSAAGFIPLDDVYNEERNIDARLKVRENVEDSNQQLLKRLLSFITEGGKYADLVAAERWMNEYSDNVTLALREMGLAEWNYSTNITDATSEEKDRVMLKHLPMFQEGTRQAKNFYRYQQSLANDTLKRMLKGIARCGDSQSSNDQLLQQLSSRLETIYGSGTVTRDTSAGLTESLQLEPELTEIFTKSRDYDELEWAWLAWRNVSGQRMRSDYTQFVSLQNQATRNGGVFNNTGAMWRGCEFEEPVKKNATNKNMFVEEMTKDLFEQIKPLYDELHAYVRYKLREHYKDHLEGPFADDRSPIPAHLLGDMWSQQWFNIFDLVKPYPDLPDTDVTDEMKRQNWTVNRMFRTAESFFASLGLDNMTDIFWRKSMLTKPSGRNVVCHASAVDLLATNDFRIKMCSEVDQDYLETIHHEMGHIEYFMQYDHQPVLFRDGANTAFHEAVGDTIALSVMTPRHLHTIGLIHREGDVTPEATINFLMKRALYKIAFLPFGYLIDKWRWGVFSGEINKSNYNRKWWEMRVKYQGVAPPVQRTEEDFDPGAKYHIAANVPYIRYFFSFILQFQFHQALCLEKGHELDQLHTCDIYKSKKAGKLLREMLRKGSSESWPDVLEAFTGMRKFDTSAISNYFRPLTNFLKEQREAHGYPVGWDESIHNYVRQ